MDEVVKSRSTLASSLTQLQQAGLLARKVMETRPVGTEYSLTQKGLKLAELLGSIKDLLQV